MADFPAVAGKTLQELADTAKAGPQAALATSVLVPGENRLAFGVLDAGNNSVYGKTAVYVAPTPTSKAAGPYPAPADSLLTDGRFPQPPGGFGGQPPSTLPRSRCNDRGATPCWW